MTRSVTFCIGSYVLALVVAGFAGSALAAETRDIMIIVHEGEETTFMGLGGSSTGDDGYAGMSEAVRTDLANAVWKDADFRVLRLWCHRTTTAASFASSFRQLIADARKANPEVVLLLGPTGTVTGQMQQHCAHHAQIIKDLRDSYGITIQATGVTNEPNAHDDWLPQEAAAGVKAMRAALDSRGLQDVKLIAPEVSNVDEKGISYIENIIADQDALDAIDAFSTHSYSMCMTRALRDLEKPCDKEHWQTEASANGPETFTDYRFGTSVAIRILSDINLGITHWCYFLVYSSYDENDNRTRVLGYDPGAGTFRPFYKFHYMGNISRAFSPGTVMRNATSDLDWVFDWYNEAVDKAYADSGQARFNYMIWDERMVFMEQTYGVKAPVALACGRRPDGKWAIGITNFSGDCAPLDGDQGCWVGGTTLPDMIFDAVVRVEELTGAGDIEFEVHRTNGDEEYADEGTVTMSGGEVEVSVDQYDLLTLVSTKSVDPSTSHAARTTRGRGRTLLTVSAPGDGLRRLVRYRVGSEGARAADVQLGVYDMAGRLVKALATGPAPAGEYSVALETETMNAGVYVLKLRCDNATKSARLVLAK